MHYRRGPCGVHDGGQQRGGALVRLSMGEPAGESALAEVLVLRASVRKMDHEVIAACARKRLGGGLGRLARRKVSQHAPGLVPNDPVVECIVGRNVNGGHRSALLLTVVNDGPAPPCMLAFCSAR